VTRKDRAWNYKGKGLESSGRHDGSEKGSNSRKQKQKELVDRKRAHAGQWKDYTMGKRRKC